MAIYDLISISNLAIIALSIALFYRMAWAGSFSERHLRLGPTRDLSQPGWVYLAGAAGVLLYSFLKLTVTRDQPTQVLILIEIIPYALIGFLLGRARSVEAGFRKIGFIPRWPVRDTAWGLIGGVIGLGLASATGTVVNLISIEFGHPVDQVAHEALKTLREEFSTDVLINLAIGAVIIAPIVEEIVFRGLFQTSLLRLFREMRWPALFIASFVFALIHWSVVPWQGLIPLFVLGMVFGYLYERTGSLLTPILAHAVFNAANIGIALVMPDAPPA